MKKSYLFSVIQINATKKSKNTSYLSKVKMSSLLRSSKNGSCNRISALLAKRMERDFSCNAACGKDTKKRKLNGYSQNNAVYKSLKYYAIPRTSHASS